VRTNEIAMAASLPRMARSLLPAAVFWQLPPDVDAAVREPMSPVPHRWLLDVYARSSVMVTGRSMFRQRIATGLSSVVDALLL